MASVNKLVKPFLKWAGGRRQIIQTIIATHLPQNFTINHNRYYEPFIGRGALLFTLRPRKAVINDVNAELSNCYKVIRDSLDELIDELKRHENEKNYYYAIRDWDRDKNYNYKIPVERAPIIIFLNKTCFNGLFRVNYQGQFNVPFGKYKTPNILDVAVLKAVSMYLSQNQIEIVNLDFKQAVKNASKCDFIYFDPPYNPVSDTASFTGYALNGFNRNEQKRLKKTFDELNGRGCNILLSNAYKKFILNLYKDYSQTKTSAIRAINSNASKRGKVDEILVKNYE